MGATSPAAVASVIGVMEEATRGMTSLVIGVGGLGVFPNPLRVQVIWAGVTGDPGALGALSALRKRLDDGLARLGFVPEARAFTAHLTLARIRDDASPADREAAGRRVQASAFEGDEFVVDSISLMRSELGREGPRYMRLAATRFGATAPGS
jgi:2'-5' RNA ligase